MSKAEFNLIGRRESRCGSYVAIAAQKETALKGRRVHHVLRQACAPRRGHTVQTILAKYTSAIPSDKIENKRTKLYCKRNNQTPWVQLR